MIVSIVCALDSLRLFLYKADQVNSLVLVIHHNIYICQIFIVLILFLDQPYLTTRQQYIANIARDADELGSFEQFSSQLLAPVVDESVEENAKET